MNLRNNEINLIRDAALSLEKTDMQKALALMLLARRLRPRGDFIVKKCEEFLAQRIIQGSYVSQDSLLDYRNAYLVSKTASQLDTRYIISADINNIYSGLGCMILVLGPAWKYAKLTGRTLVVDWRNNPYTRADSTINLFSRLFDSSKLSEAGVDVMADDQVNAQEFPDSILMSKIEQQHEEDFTVSSGGRGLESSEIMELVMAGVDVEAGTFIPSLSPMYQLATKHGLENSMGLPPVCSREETFLLYRNLRPVPEIQRQIDGFCKDNFFEEPIIGVHVRHGNGEGDTRQHFLHRVISEFDEFIDSIIRRIEKVAEQRKLNRYRVFLCTDSGVVIDEFRERIPNTISREIWRPDRNKGIDFDHDFDSSQQGIDAAANALIDMQLLARCDVVILTRPTSFACHVPYILEKQDAEFIDSASFEKI